MVLQMPRPFKHPKTGVYYFRVRVPADLVGVLGRAEVKASLGTKDPLLAKERFAQRAGEVSAEWAALRARPVAIPHRQLVALSGKLYRRIMKMFEDEPGESDLWQRALAAADAAHANPELAERWYGPTVDELLTSEGIAADAYSRQRLLDEAHRAYQQAARQQLKRSQGDYSPDPDAGRFPELESKPGGPTDKTVTVGQLYDLWKREHLADGKAERTTRDHLHKIENLIAFLEHDDAARVRPEDIVRWSEHLRHEAGLSAKTVADKYLSAARAVFGTGVGKFRIKASPVEKVRVNVPKKRKERSSGFTDEEAVQILKAALVAEDQPTKAAPLNKLACKWVPWICAYTGARGGEIAQLRGEDFVTEFGVLCIRITPEAGSVKTGDFRLVPLHPHLVELGLQDLAKRSKGPLFFRPKNAKPETWAKQAANVRGKVSEWVRDGAKVADSRVQPNHAWRHRFKTLARDVDMGQRYMDAIQGHSDGSASAEYGENTVKALYREIQKLPRYNVDERKSRP